MAAHPLIRYLIRCYPKVPVAAADVERDAGGAGTLTLRSHAERGNEGPLFQSPVCTLVPLAHPGHDNDLLII
jgi:hypothetical protein